MAKNNTQRMLEKLESLAREAGHNLFERVVIADTILKDEKWVAEQGGIVAAKSRLYQVGFTATAVDMNELLLIFKHFPDKEEWVKVNFSVRLLAKEAKKLEPKQEKRGGQPERMTVAKMQLRLDEVEAQLRAALRENSELKDKIIQLQQANSLKDGELERVRRELRQLAAAEKVEV